MGFLYDLFSALFSPEPQRPPAVRKQTDNNTARNSKPVTPAQPKPAAPEQSTVKPPVSPQTEQSGNAQPAAAPPAPKQKNVTEAAAVKNEAPKAKQPKPKPASEPVLEGVVKPEEIYIPEYAGALHIHTERIEMTEAEAIVLGWRFRKKSRMRARITHYFGSRRDLVIPAKIGEYTVNELGEKLFFKAEIDSVRIPDTVKKLGKSCFAWSTVQSIEISDGVREIPEEFALCCKQLREVKVGITVSTIGNRAFAHCEALPYFRFPYDFYSLGDRAFYHSGLRGFSMVRAFNAFTSSQNGSAFLDTPLAAKYKLLASKSSNDTLHILLVCSGHPVIRLPACKAYFGSNAVPDERNSVRLLDCSQCLSVSFAAQTIAFQSSTFSNTIKRNALSVILPPKHTDTIFPGCVDVRYPDGKKYDFFEINLEESPNICCWFLPSFAYRRSDQSVSFKKCRSMWMEFQPNAICSDTLVYASFGRIQGEGQLFHPVCSSLHYVEWEQLGKSRDQNESFHVYLPGRSEIEHYRQEYLLKAFRSRSKTDKLHPDFFDSSVFDRIFRWHNTKTHCYTHEEYLHMVNSEHKKYRRENNKPPHMNQRQKILLALDVLRSTEALFPNRAMYETYLQNHLRYARAIADELPEEYRNLLTKY